MKPVNLSQAIITSVCFAFGSGAFAQALNADDTAVPVAERELAEVYKQELEAKTKAEMAERELRRTRNQFEQRRSQVDREIVEKRAHINDLKVKQEELDQQVQAYRADLKQLEAKQTEQETELKRVSEYAKTNTDAAMDVKAQLDASKQDLTNNLYMLSKKREETFKRIDTAQSQINKWHEEIARTNQDIIAADNTRLEYEKAAMKIGHQVAEMEQKVRDANEAKSMALEETKQMKDNLAKANDTLNKTVAKMRDAEKARDIARNDLNKMRSVYGAEMKRLDDKTAQAHMLKALAENERNRSETETARLNDTLNKVKQLHEEVSLEVVEAQSALMQSKISLGQIRTDLTRELATKDSTSRPTRSLASSDGPMAATPKVEKMPTGLGDDNMMPRGGDMKVRESKTHSVASVGGELKNWSVHRVCNIYKNADANSPRLAKVKANDLVQATSHNAGFVKVATSGGNFGYIRSSCGNFDN